MTVQLPRSLRRCKSPVYTFAQRFDGEPKLYCISLAGNKSDIAPPLNAIVFDIDKPNATSPSTPKLPETMTLPPNKALDAADMSVEPET